METSFDLRFLGTVQVSRDGRPLGGFRSRKALGLLGYLAVQHQPTPRDQLVALLWESQPEQSARANLSWVLNRIALLLPACLAADRHTVELQRSQAYRIDTDTFEHLFAQGGASALASAVDLYRGDFLEGLVLEGCAEFEIWLEGERERWRQQVMQALESLAGQYSRGGAYAPALSYARRLLALEPWQERTHGQVMELLARCGQRSAALRQYETCRRLLADELGAEPAPETTALYERILASVSARRSGLPAQPSPFIGRQQELAQIAGLLDSPDCRLLTIMGPGGIGKTRLALQAAAGRSERYLEGIHFVPLAAVSSPEFLASAIADSLQLALFERQAPEAQLVSHLRGAQMLLILDGMEHLLDGRDLLVRLLEAAPALQLLVTSREYLQLRWEWRLDIGGLDYPTGERECEEDLAGYSAVQLFCQTARRMQPSFSLSGSNGPAVAHICCLAEGMPLSIELAAAWVGDHTCTDIALQIEHNLGFLATSLHDVPERHRSLRATFEHSWRLVSPHGQRVFAGLSVFRGGFSAHAALEVAGASPADLQSLAGKSLVRAAPAGRYELHELLRQCAAEKLASEPEQCSAVLDRHCAWTAAFVQEQEASLVGAGAAEAMASTRMEIENVRAAWQWALAQGRVEDLARSLAGLARFYLLAGPFDEGEQLLRQAEECLRGLASGPLRARVLPVLGRLLAERARFLNRLGQHDAAIAAAREASELAARGPAAGPLALCHLQWGEALLRQGRFDAALARLEQALALARTAGLQREEAECLSDLAGVFAQRGDCETARSYCEQALEISRQLGDPWGESRALNNLGVVARRQGDYAHARTCYEQALGVKREIGHRRGEAIALGNLGIVLRCQGDYAGARDYYEQALRIYREVGDRQGEGDALNNLGGVCVQQDDYAAARACREQALRLHREVGDRLGESRALGNLGIISLYQGDCGQALACLEEALHTYLEVGDRRGEMQVLEYLGLAFAYLGAYARASQCQEQALDLAHEIGDEKAQADTQWHLALLCQRTGDGQRALAYGRQALAAARKIGNPSVEADALTCLGQALEGQNELQEAAAVYAQALALRRGLGERNRGIECLAGVVRVSLALGALADARAGVEEILQHLQAHTLEGTLEPCQIYLTCYHTLRALQDPRAPAILAAARRLLAQHAASIEDRDLRRSFLEDVPSHRELRSAAGGSGGGHT